MSKLSDVVIHSSNLPFNGTTLECDGDELRPDGTCAKCERVNQRIAARFQPEDERVKEARQDAVRLIDQLEGIEDLLSRGPWEASQPDPFPYKVTIGNYTFDCPAGSSQIRAEQSSIPSHCLIPSGIIHHGDAEGIAELRNLIPDLIKTLRSLLPVQAAQCDVCRHDVGTDEEGRCKRVLVFGDDSTERCRCYCNAKDGVILEGGTGPVQPATSTEAQNDEQR